MKLAKLSLAAIMTVGALSTANAQPLEEAIKNVDFSGMVRYRMDDVNQGDATNSNTNDWDILGKVTAPVTSNIKATVAFATAGGSDDMHAAGPSVGNLDIRKVFFTYKQDALTVKAGLQPIATLVTDGGFNGTKGNGVVAMYNLGSVTLAGAYFGNSNAAADAEVTALAAIGSFGVVNAQAWYVGVENMIDSSLALDLSAKVAGVSLHGQVFQTKMAEEVVGSAEDSGMFYAVQAGYKMDNFALNAGYIKNDEDQATHSLAVDSGGQIWPGWRLGYITGNAADAEAMFFDIGATFGKFGAKVGYATSEIDKTNTTYSVDPTYALNTATGAIEVDNQAAVDASKSVTALDNTGVDEIWGQVSYKVAKNFNTYVKYSVVSYDEAGVDDKKHMRFEAKYSF